MYEEYRAPRSVMEKEMMPFRVSAVIEQNSAVSHETDIGKDSLQNSLSLEAGTVRAV